MSSKKDKRQVNLERDCIQSRRDKIRITRHIMMQYIVQLPNEEGDMHIISYSMVILCI